MATLGNASAFNAPDQIHWCNGKTPKRTRVGKNGQRIVEKFPASIYRMMIDRQGNVVPAMLTNGAGTTKPEEGQVRKRLGDLERKGFFAAYECPIATRSPGFARRETRVTEIAPRETPCPSHLDGDGAPKVVQGTMCKHVRAEAKARARAAKLADKAFRDQFKSDAVRMMELMAIEKGVKLPEAEDEDDPTEPTKEPPGRVR